MSDERLEVHLYGSHVADVIDAGAGECAVHYTESGLRIGSPARLSLAMPPAAPVYASTRFGTRWVRSLLPEGRALQWAITEFAVPEDDRFALLSVLGRDIAGAAQVVTPGSEVDGVGFYEPLGSDQVAELVSRAHDQPLALQADRGVRLSLAGMQDKVVLHRPLRSPKYYLPVDGAASTVILKPQPSAPQAGPATPGLVANEALCLRLAAETGLRVARARVETFGSVPCLVVARFDRVAKAGGMVERIHQEDLLTAMGRDPHLKYEIDNEVYGTRAGGFAERRPVRNDPGPSLNDFAEFLSLHLGKGVLLTLLEIVTLNVAIGNADAHARNLSVQLHPDGTVTLAPLYDLVSTRHYEHLNAQAAQAVDGTFDIDHIGPEQLINHAHDWGLTKATVSRRVTGVLDKLAKRLDKAAAATVAAGASADDVSDVAATIRGRLEHLRT